MEALEAVTAVIRGRRSVRTGYFGKPPTQERLLEIVQAGTLAPSGSNTQSVRFLVETRPAEVRRLSELRKGGWPYHEAGALILVFVDRRKDASRGSRGAIWRQLGYQDSAAAIQNMLLVATACGLGSCWISAYQNMEGGPLLSGQAWHEVLADYHLAPELEIMGIVALGHVRGTADGDEEHRGRRVNRRTLAEYLLLVDGVQP